MCQQTATDHFYRGCRHTLTQEPVYDSCSSRFCMASLEHPKDNAHRAVCECMPCPPVQHILIQHEGKCAYCAERARRIAEAQQTAIRFVQRTLQRDA